MRLSEGGTPAGLCEAKHQLTGNSCPAQAVYTVAYGTREHDAQDSCRRHLAATVEAMTEGTAHPVTVTLAGSGQ